MTESELHLIKTLGPWPPVVRTDPSNRVSGKPLAIELGRRLFRDPRMSPVGYIACVTCHQPDRAFTDLKARAHGLADLPRNTPSLFNLSQQRWFGRDGASDSLWMASIRPMLDNREFDSSPATIARLFVRDPQLAACYRHVFGTTPHVSPARTVINVGKALAAFQETLVTERTPFDDFRDALLRHDARAAREYPESARRGLKLFIGQGQCITCHSGPYFSDDRFHRVLPMDNNADAGRLDGARSVKASPLNLLGRYNDDPTRANQRATQRLDVREALRGQFRTPSLRNVSTTGPYLHDGRADSLHMALQHGGPLSAAQASDLADFLATLTDRYAERRPWTADTGIPCP